MAKGTGATPMSIKSFVLCAKALGANISILLRADHGVGKSQVVHQLAEHFKLPCIDRRLSQMSEGDMIGLPSTDGEVTRFNPPDWYKRACRQPCILFLDELNRATPEVMQAAFQVVLDRELNGHKLHPETRVFAAINSSANYTVNEVDPALLDRFWCVDLTPTVEDWLLWARDPEAGKLRGSPLKDGNVCELVVDFIASNERWLDPSDKAEPGSVQSSRRTWERVSDTLVTNGIEEEPENPLFYILCLGFMGTECSAAFHGYAKSVDFRVTGEEIVNKWSDKVLRKLKKMGQERQNVAIEKVADYVVGTDKSPGLTKLTKKQGTNLGKFMQQLPGELKISLWSRLTACGMDKIDLAKGIHKYCADNVLDVFGVPMGEEGIGVVPDIPGMFDEKEE